MKRQSKRRTLGVFIVAVAVVAGFFIGRYDNQIFGAIAPVFGIKVYTGTLDTTRLQQVYQTLKAHYDGTLDDSKLIDGALHGLVNAAGDQYTVYMNSSEASDFNNDLDGNVGAGIGVALELQSSALTITELLPDNPGIKAGLKVGDQITAINGESTTGQSVDASAAKIRGAIGTTVKLTIMRGSVNSDYSLTRATINNPSVTSSVQNGVGILTISRFDNQTGDQARTAALSFKKQNVKAVILDLRNNGGGYVDAAQEVASLWLSSGVIVTERTNGTIVSTLSASGDALLAGLPTAVLVNGNTASASEIVSGALKDHHAATIVGEKTFGKGSVQEIFDFSGGAQLKVTIAKWYTPDGKNINKEGITPDVIVDLTQANIDAGQDPQMAAAFKALGQ